MKEIKPLGNRVLLEQQYLKEETTPSGIIIAMDETNPDHREKQLTGIITCLGKGVDKTLGLKLGNLVRFAKHSEVSVDPENDLILVKDCDIQAIIYNGENDETK